MKLVPPLRTQARRAEREDAAPPLDRLAEPDLIGKDRALRQRVLEGEKRRVDLVGVALTALPSSVIDGVPSLPGTWARGRTPRPGHALPPKS